MFNFRSFLSALICLLALSMFNAVPEAKAQGLSMPKLGGSEGSKQEQQDPQALRDSLDQVIGTLESDAQRNDLLARLKELRDATDAAAEGSSSEMPRQGLLGALADSFSGFSEQSKAGSTPLDTWTRRIQSAKEDSEVLLDSTNRVDLLRDLVEAAVLLGIWVGILFLLIGAGRLLAKRNEWPLLPPPEPRGWVLVIHLLRKVLPWALAFLFMLAALYWLTAPTLARTVVLIVAYIALCGRLLSTVFDVVISLFTRGHRWVAVALLRRQALRLLFVIGALAALGDATNSGRIEELMGEQLAGLISVSANVIAGLISGMLILRIKRPVKHLIRNRPYSQRHANNTRRELVNFIGKLWHIPALLLIGASLAAIFFSAGEADRAFTRAIICAALLVLTLVVNGLIQRHSEKPTHRKRKTQYRKRLERFGYTLAYFAFWALFAELSLRVWGFSLLGFGEEGAISARIGQALLGIGITVLLAWLAWIFADTAIQRALYSSARSRGQRVQSARIQTITPLIRNVIFITIILIAAIIGLANLGVNVTPLLAGAGVIGLAIGFGAQTLVQDLITGLFILIEDSLSVDDFVDVAGHVGTVEGLTLRTVRLRDLDGIVHVIPFSEIKGIQNFSRQFGIAMIRIRVPHNMKIDDAIILVREVAEELRQDPILRHHIWSALEVQGVESFDEGAAVMRVRMRTGPVMQWDVARAFNLRLKQRLDSIGQDLAIPRMSVVMENTDKGDGGGTEHSAGSRSDGVGHAGPSSEGDTSAQG